MADAQDSKSCEGDLMWVQVPLPAPNKTNPNHFSGTDFFVWYSSLLSFRFSLFTYWICFELKTKSEKLKIIGVINLLYL